MSNSVYNDVYFVLKSVEWVCIFCNNQVKTKHLMSVKDDLGAFLFCFGQIGNECFVFLAFCLFLEIYDALLE